LQLVRASPPSPVIPPRPAPDDGVKDARERLLRTAYELFLQHGFAAVGVDRIVAEAGVAKTTLYRHFRSKNDLVVAVLERHEDLWTVGWLEPETRRLAGTNDEQIVAVFEAFDEWFRDEGYQGCILINSLLEVHDDTSPIHSAALGGIERVYERLVEWAENAGVQNPAAFAHRMQLLMRGSIVAAVEGHFEAVAEAGTLARELLAQERTKA
jgi:AcrR family transcriptional regulator